MARIGLSAPGRGPEESLAARFREIAGDGSTVSPSAREALAAAAALVPVGIVTRAVRVVLDEVLAAAGLAHHVAFTVTAEDVSRTKPDPEGYLLALGGARRPAGGRRARLRGHARRRRGGPRRRNALHRRRRHRHPRAARQQRTRSWTCSTPKPCAVCSPANRPGVVAVLGVALAQEARQLGGERVARRQVLVLLEVELVGAALELRDVGRRLLVGGDRLGHLLGVGLLRLGELGRVDRRRRAAAPSRSQSARAARGLGASET